jgi:hypothetical protein
MCGKGEIEPHYPELDLHLSDVPHTVFDTKGLHATRGERIEAAVISGGKRVTEPHEA